MVKLFDEWYSGNEINIIKNLKEYLSIDTSSPNEEKAFIFLNRYLNSIDFEVTKIYIDPTLKNHELYTYHPNSIINKERFNIKAVDRKNNNKDSLKVLFNSHIDVVPKSSDFLRAFKPEVQNGYLYGRGACDTKNNLIMLVEAIRFLRDNNLPIKKEIEIDLVIEEEITGNGTLAALQDYSSPDFIVVLEPTNLNVYRGHRGVITTQIDIYGKSVHMGSDLTGESAIENAIKIIELLKYLEQKLLNIAHKNNGFKCWEKPVQVNIGKIKGGEWAGSVPEKCTILANIGFTDEFSIKNIKQEITSFIKENCGSINVEIGYPELRNAAYLIDENNIHMNEFLNSVNGVISEKQEKTYGWRVSCDAHYYHELLSKPTIIFGCGDLKDAHSSHERIKLEELKDGIQILANYLSI